MWFNRRLFIIPTLAIMTVAMLIAPRIVASGQDQGAYKLEGAWIAKVTGMDGVPAGTPLPFQWSYVVAPNASGRRASLHGSVDVPFPSTVAYDYVTPITGELVQTGPDTTAFSAIWYVVRRDSPVNQVVLIGTATGEGRFIAPGRLEGTHHFAFYLPSADIDGDGFPEGSPINTFNATTLDRRVLVEF
jgi:hypothetical protein